MPPLLSILSQYELLETIANYTSTLDLLHLACANSQLYTLIRKSQPIFDRLKSVALCDGRGLGARQNFEGIYKLRPGDYTYTYEKATPQARFDEEIEVRVWNVNCDSTNGLPCNKCGVNVCEECRYFSRVRDLPRFMAYPKPHIVPSEQIGDVMGFCDACDAKVEHDLPLPLSEYCTCDQYTRWICVPCKVKEKEAIKRYFSTSTKMISMDIDGITEIYDGLWLQSLIDAVGFWCPCGERAPKDGHVRCCWCKKRHDMATWQSGDAFAIPFFDQDPCYPRVVYDNTGEQMMYPQLGYMGPIHR